MLEHLRRRCDAVSSGNPDALCGLRRRGDIAVVAPPGICPRGARNSTHCSSSATC